MADSKVIVLQANLNNFDKVSKPVKQNIPVDYHCFTDEDFPPITGLTPRLQYRIPKMWGWQMIPGYDYYIWLDGSVTLKDPDSAKWMIDELGNNDIAFFRHPHRKTVKEEVDHIEEHLKQGKKYITSRYKNGLHKESLAFTGDGELYASPVFIYKPSALTALVEWWTIQSRYYTCDQVSLTHALKGVKYGILPGDDPFENKYIKRVSKHA